MTAGGVQQTIGVTGARGFIGRRVVAALLAQGHSVRAISRSREASPDGATTAVVSDLSDEVALAAALAGVHSVIHLAARVHVMTDTAADPLAEFRRVNVHGTEALARVAKQAGVRRFVFVSSVKAVGESSDARWTESTIPAPVDPYGVSKLEAEHAVDRVFGTDAVSIRLPLVYGPGMRGNMLRLFAAIRRGLPIPVGLPANRRSVIAVDNVAFALARLATIPAVPRRVYFAADPTPISVAQLVDIVARSLGRPARKLPIPTRALAALAKVGDRIPGVPLNSAMVKRLTSSLEVDAGPLWRDVGPPPLDTEAGIRVAAEWFTTQ